MILFGHKFTTHAFVGKRKRLKESFRRLIGLDDTMELGLIS